MPEVSVIMPVFCVADPAILREAVMSVKKQTYLDWELLIYGDGAAERTMEWVRQAAGQDGRIHVMHSRKNHGAAYARNACIRKASGSYIAVMDADDISDPRRLEKQVSFLDSHLEYDFVGCCAKLIGSRGIWGERWVEERPDKRSFLSTLPFIHPSLMFRKTVLEELHGYAETADALRMEDYDLLMRLYAQGKRGYNLQELLFSYREDLDSYRRRRYRYRIDECRVRYRGFCRLEILKGNYRYVIKPLAAGLVPHRIMYRIRLKKFGKRAFSDRGWEV